MSGLTPQLRPDRAEPGRVGLAAQLAALSARAAARREYGKMAARDQMAALATGGQWGAEACLRHGAAALGAVPGAGARLAGPLLRRGCLLCPRSVAAVPGAAGPRECCAEGNVEGAK